jgi:hypothetical protein
VSYNQDTKFALFGVRTWEIWRWQGTATKQENLDDIDFMETKEDLMQGKVEHAPRQPWGINTTP